MGDPHSRAAQRVGERVQQLRERASLSRRRLAECAELDTTHLQRIERGETNPTLSTLLQVAIALEIELVELIRGVGADDIPAGRLPYGYSQRESGAGGEGWGPSMLRAAGIVPGGSDAV